MVCFFMCPSKPPEKVNAKGGKGNVQEKMMTVQGYPNTFAVPLKSACCADPVCCLGSTVCAPFGVTACWARNTVLNKFHRGTQDFVCFQGYIGKCCCADPRSCFPGSPVGLCLEGCCCPVLSLSIARIHLMDTKHIQPDPMDWQIIQFSNFLQILSCVCNIAAIFVEELREAALILDIIADIVTLSVAGCMGAQINQELKKQDTPVVTGHVVGRIGAPPAGEVMVR